MNINYHAPFSINDYLKNLVEENFAKIERLGLRYSQADVYFKLKDGSHGQEDKEIEIKVQVPGQTLFAKSFSDEFEKAIPEGMSKMRRQVIKYKESIQHH